MSSSAEVRVMDIPAEFWPIVGMSLRVSGTAVLLSALVGLPFGTWLGLTRWRGAVVVRWGVHIGMALPPVVVGLVLYLLLSRSGPLGGLDWLYTPRAMTAAQFILALPFVIGITASVIRGVPSSLTEQLRALGATRGQAARAIVYEARHGLGLAVAAALGRSLSEVGAVLIVGGNIAGHTRVLTTAIVLETAQGRFAMALLLGASLLALAALVNALIVVLQEGDGHV